MTTEIKSIVTASDMRRDLFRILDRIRKPNTRFMITVGGKPRAVVLSIDEWESILATMDIATDPEMVKAIERADKDFEEKNYYTLDEVLDEAGLEVVRDKAVKYKVKRKNKKLIRRKRKR